MKNSAGDFKAGQMVSFATGPAGGDIGPFLVARDAARGEINQIIANGLDGWPVAVPLADIVSRAVGELLRAGVLTHVQMNTFDLVMYQGALEFQRHGEPGFDQYKD